MRICVAILLVCGLMVGVGCKSKPIATEPEQKCKCSEKDEPKVKAHQCKCPKCEGKCLTGKGKCECTDFQCMGVEDGCNCVCPAN